MSHGHEFTYEKTLFGFWVYLLTDAVLFGVLFAVYAILKDNTAGGPALSSLFHLKMNLAETLVLLGSTLTGGFALLALDRGKRGGLMGWLLVTLLLGGTFLFLELSEFKGLMSQGVDWTRSAAYSGFFTLVGTHGVHIFFGLLWMVVMLFQVGIHGINHNTVRRMACFRLFWQFSFAVWVLVFLVVYLAGVA